MQSRKISYSWVLLILLIALLVTFFLRCSVKIAKVDSKTNGINSGESEMPAQTENRAVTGGNEIEEDPRMKEFRRKEEMDPLWPRKTPIAFYGKVIDEAGQPLSKVTAELSWPDLSPNGGSTRLVASDENGLFSLVGVKGKSLSVYLKKDGYYTMRNNPVSFEFAYFFERDYYRPDPEHPVLFTMHKKGEAEPLIYRTRSPETPRDGTPAFLDFMTGNLSPNGQFSFQAWRPPIQETRSGPFEWRIKIGIKGGGLLSHDEEFPFLAPTDGYTNEIEVSMIPGVSPEWQFTWGTNFYFYYSQPPKYGRMEFSTGGKSRGYALQYWFNPTGSQNLEFDPHKQISQ